MVAFRGEPFWGYEAWMTGRGRGRGQFWGGASGAGRDRLQDAWGEFWRGPAPRAERGTVRWLVLDAIASLPRHGYEIIQSIAERSRGTYKPSPGVIYPTLQMLEELGHVRAAAREERKTYEITEEGKRELEEHTLEVSDFYASAGEGDWELHAEDIAAVMKRVMRIMHLFKHGMRRGRVRPSTARAMRAILDEALAKLEALLATEEP